MSNSKAKINIVWIKRDIRSQDHKPLDVATNSGLPFMIVFVFEPSIISYPDTSLRHLQFQYGSLMALNQTLENYGGQVNLLYGEMKDILKSISEEYDIQSLLSYQESGIEITYERDKSVSKFCKENGIVWQENQRDGIIRGICNRRGWDKAWHGSVQTDIIKNKYSTDQIKIWEQTKYNIPKHLENLWANYPQEWQPPGESQAMRYLTSFCQSRAKNYMQHISKPEQARMSCSRLSPYLAWGNLSSKQVYVYASAMIRDNNHKRNIGQMLTRLKWRDHFIQKFEVACKYETDYINRGYELLQRDERDDLVVAWKTGQTGIPMVDASMRSLCGTGWLNFRMRAMLVSFLTHHLFQDWKLGVYHMAQQFLDYEPGIHYPQFQMQAGITGVNTIRIYNPIKQGLDHDKDGLFIKKWIPELANVPSQLIHQPWMMTLIEQDLYNTKIGMDYPKPIIDIDQAIKTNRAILWSHQKNQVVIEEGQKILQIHTRRNQIS